MEKQTIDNTPTIEQASLTKAVVIGFKDKVEKTLTRKEKRKIKKERKKIREAEAKKERRENGFNIEPLIAKEKKGSNHFDNLKVSTILAHEGKHLYLGNKLPHEQINQILDDNYSALNKNTREEIIREINKILDSHLQANTLYNDKCFKK